MHEKDCCTLSRGPAPRWEAVLCGQTPAAHLAPATSRPAHNGAEVMVVLPGQPHDVACRRPGLSATARVACPWRRRQARRGCCWPLRSLLRSCLEVLHKLQGLRGTSGMTLCW